MKNKTVVAAIALITVFLVGFVPQYVKVSRLENELRQSRQEAAGAELRDLIGFAYLQASQKNYGLAAETSSRFFNRVREVANQTQEVNRRKRPGGSARVTGQRHGSVGEGRRGGDGRSPATLPQGAAGDTEFELAVELSP